MGCGSAMSAAASTCSDARPCLSTAAPPGYACSYAADASVRGSAHPDSAGADCFDDDLFELFNLQPKIYKFKKTVAAQAASALSKRAAPTRSIAYCTECSGRQRFVGLPPEFPRDAFTCDQCGEITEPMRTCKRCMSHGIGGVLCSACFTKSALGPASRGRGAEA